MTLRRDLRDLTTPTGVRGLSDDLRLVALQVRGAARGRLLWLAAAFALEEIARAFHEEAGEMSMARRAA